MFYRNILNEEINHLSANRIVDFYLMLSVISITMVENYWVGTKGEGKWANCKPPLEFGFGHVTKYTNVLHTVLLIPV